MSPPDASPRHGALRFDASAPVPRPSVVQSLGGALNQAFGRCDPLPDDLADLLRALESADADHLAGD